MHTQLLAAPLLLNCAETESACYTSVNETLSDADVCPPQADGSLPLAANSTCCQALTDADDCWDSLVTQDEAPLWTVGGKEYGV